MEQSTTQMMFEILLNSPKANFDNGLQVSTNNFIFISEKSANAKMRLNKYF